MTLYTILIFMLGHTVGNTKYSEYSECFVILLIIILSICTVADIGFITELDEAIWEVIYGNVY